MKLVSFVLMLYFSLLSLAPNWQGIQLLNTSAFLRHYEDYQAETKDGNVLSFIQEHYFNQFQDFDKDHEKLPFKSTVQVSVIYFAEKFEVPTPVVNCHEYVLTRVHHNNRKLGSFISNDFHSIWHPPQLG